MKYRIQRYGNNGYKVQSLSERNMFGKKREKWVDHKEGMMDVYWTKKYSMIENAKKDIKRLIEDDKNDVIGWKTVYKTQ